MKSHDMHGHPGPLSPLPAMERLDRREIISTLDKLARVSIAVIGDFCLDIYWTIDRTASEVSIETGLKTEPVREQRCSPGGAGNVVMNLAALGLNKIYPVGVLGKDPYGYELRRLLAVPEVNGTGLICQEEGWATPTYIKPCVDNRELSRLDFGNFNRLSEASERELFTRLETILGEVSVVLINHQVTGSMHDAKSFRERLAQVINRHPHLTFLIDSRGYHEAYPRALHKLNDREVMTACGQPVEAGKEVAPGDLVEAARRLCERWKSPLVVTRGERGCLVFTGEERRQIFGLQLPGPTDPVGAGDTFSAVLAATVPTGADLVVAAYIANIAAAVTAQKLFQTGTASRAEILALGSQVDFVFHPELAGSPRQARRIGGSEIEIIAEPLPRPHLRHAIFDHDGTISTLREGWEKIMEPMMIKAVLGTHHGTGDEMFHRVRSRVRAFIERTTGIQTIAQMNGLVELVHEFGLVPEQQILSAAKYKAIFNEELMGLVNQRLAKLDSGEYDTDDFTLKGAVPFLHALNAAGVRLYLASGTDEEDARREAKRLGYAEVFADRIYGSIGQVARDAKRVVIERILNEVNGAAEQLVTFGDGPVEMRETSRHGALAVGVASDEVRRFGLNPEKRARLIRAGANAVVPDFSQWQKLWEVLHLPARNLCRIPNSTVPACDFAG